MKLIVGLGNPGEKYENTRHNFGYTVVEKLLKDLSSASDTVWSSQIKLKSDIALVDWQPKSGEGEKLILAKPTTFMNNSGQAVSLLASYYKIAPEDVWVVYDELDLPVGAMKIRFGGAAAGHHGVESIIASLNTDSFWRFRLGIGVSHPHTGQEMRVDGKSHVVSKQTMRDAEGFVLGTFGSSEKGKIRELIKHGSAAIQMALEKGIDSAMNRYNTK
jgi:peptidyl-tRNA hydrolase, PTH1 family